MKTYRLENYKQRFYKEKGFSPAFQDILINMQFMDNSEQKTEPILLSHIYIAAYYYAVKAAVQYISINGPDTDNFKFLLCVPANPEEERLQFNQQCFKAAYEQV